MDELPGDGLVRRNGGIVALMFFILLDEGYYCYLCAMKINTIFELYLIGGKPARI